MEIPYQRLTSEVLDALVEDFLTRQGGDSGDPDFDLAEQSVKVRSMLEKGRVKIVYDEEKDLCSIVTASRW